MAKKSVDPKPKTFVRDDSPKYKKLRADYKGGRNATDVKNAMSASSGQYAGGPAPRVGADKKKGTVKVSKPSSVSSGWVPAKKKK